MSNDKSLAVIPRTLEEVNSLSELLGKSTLLPDALRGKVADIAVSILAGQELGIPPMAAIRGVHVVQGKPVLSADTMVGLVLASGLCEYFQCVEETDTRVTYEAKRRGAPMPQRCSWSSEDTKRAGLNTKETHRLYPRAMMKARCKAILARDLWPDVLAGVSSTEEITSTPRTAPAEIPAMPSTPDDIADAEIVTAPAELAELESATTRDSLKSLAPRLADLPEPWKTQARERYSARLKEITREAAANANG